MAGESLPFLIFLEAIIQIAYGLSLDKVLRNTDIITELNPSWTLRGEKIIQGDIVVPSSKIDRDVEEMKGAINVLTLWYNGRVPYNFHSSVEEDTRENIRTAIKQWEEKTCLRFTERILDIAYLRFRSDTQGCWSFIGRMSFPFSPQDVSIGPGCNHVHIIAHEIGHAIGFYHEQSRSDRDGYVNVLWDNVGEGKTSQFDMGIESSRGVEYDYMSVMHYGPMAFSRRLFEKNTMVAKNPHNQRLIGSGKGLSFRDGKTANLMYSCSAGCPNSGGESKCLNGGYLGPYRRDRQPCPCICPPKTTGEFCETQIGNYYASPSCGGNITEETEIKTPGYPNRSPDVNDACSWWIQAPPNHRVQVEFKDFSFHPRVNLSSSYQNKCVLERVEIRTYNTLDGEMFCGEDISAGTVTTSRFREFIIIISNNPESPSGRGMHAQVSFIAQRSEIPDQSLDGETSAVSSAREL